MLSFGPKVWAEILGNHRTPGKFQRMQDAICIRRLTVNFFSQAKRKRTLATYCFRAVLSAAAIRKSPRDTGELKCCSTSGIPLHCRTLPKVYSTSNPHHFNWRMLPSLCVGFNDLPRRSAAASFRLHYDQIDCGRPVNTGSGV